MCYLKFADSSYILTVVIYLYESTLIGLKQAEDLPHNQPLFHVVTSRYNSCYNQPFFMFSIYLHYMHAGCLSLHVHLAGLCSHTFFCANSIFHPYFSLSFKWWKRPDPVHICERIWEKGPLCSRPQFWDIDMFWNYRESALFCCMFHVHSCLDSLFMCVCISYVGQLRNRENHF